MRFFASIAIGFASLFALFSLAPTFAVTGADFDPSRIIDDQVFYDPDTMTVQEIQDFLWDMLDDSDQIPDGNPGSCDTNGVELYGGQTRASYAEYKYNNLNAYGIYSGTKVPFICLPQYYENPTTGENNYWEYVDATGKYENVNAGGTPTGAVSAAQIIYDISQTYGINPQVLIVLLQKEQGLVTDDWPWGIQYQKATGYGCPDTAPCNSEYYGFYNQLDKAAWQFIRYRDFPNNYGHVAGDPSQQVRYHPNVSCGSSNVVIQNQATAGLYNYTPYQPNSAALSNLYGTGDGCSSYGNRNFWRIFNDWFGSTYATLKLSSGILLSPGSGNIVTTGDSTVSFKIKNNESSPVTISSMVVVAQGPDGRYYNYPPEKDVVIPAGGEHTYTQTRTFDVPGLYKMSIAVYRPGQGFDYNWPVSENSSIVRSRFTTVVEP